MKQFMFSLAIVFGFSELAAAQQPGYGSMPSYGGMPGYGAMPSNGPMQGMPGGMPGYGPGANYGAMPGQGAVPASAYGPIANPYAAPMGGSGCGPNGCGKAGGPVGPGGKPEASRFGYNPLVKRLFHIKDECNACNNCKGGGAGAGTGGTLVFPNQPFIRSPRDFFME